MDLELGGKVALVTGGGRGIGAAICLALGREGCHVAVVDLPERGEAQSVAERIEAGGSRARVYEADVASFAEAGRVVAAAAAELGDVDILVSSAGITRDAVVWKMTEEAWDEVLAVNLKGFFSFARAVAPSMRARRWGRIVSIASINGLRGKFGQANYAAAKAGGIALTKTLARELGRDRITVNAVAPGLVTTEMTAGLPAEVVARARDETVVGSLANPEDVAGVVAFLCSPHARHVTGEVIKVDGGQYI